MTFLKLPNPNGGDWQSGYEKNGESYNYASSDDAYENGCYGYTSGKYAGHYFFGDKGTDAEKRTPLSGEKIRTECNNYPGKVEPSTQDKISFELSNLRCMPKLGSQKFW